VTDSFLSIGLSDFDWGLTGLFLIATGLTLTGLETDTDFFVLGFVG
jgi:hypothetical protein